MRLLGKKKTSQSPAQEQAKTILKNAKNVKAFGGGMASNVIRFFMEEKAKGGSTLFVQSSAGAKGKRDYAFYARMNPCSAAAFGALRDFCQYAVSHIATSAQWTAVARAAQGHSRVIIPRLLLGVEKGDPSYAELYRWIKNEHLKAKKEFNDREFASISVVEGTYAEGLDDLLSQANAKVLQPMNMVRHCLDLGLQHALDVAIGMGDRVQNPNFANITLHPETNLMVMIDVDSFLPPPGLGATIEDACKWTSADASGRTGRDNGAWPKHESAWKACPPRLPLQGNYAESVSKALKDDLEVYLARFEFVAKNIEGASPAERKQHGVTVEQARGYRAYATALRQPLHTKAFINGASCALGEIKRGVNSNTMPLSIEDETCSGARLKQFVNEWKL